MNHYGSAGRVFTCPKDGIGAPFAAAPTASCGCGGLFGSGPISGP